MYQIRPPPQKKHLKLNYTSKLRDNKRGIIKHVRMNRQQF